MPDANDPAVKETAVEWFVRLHDKAATDDDRAAFHAWLAADPAHRAAYRELERVWAGLDQLDPRPETTHRGIRTAMPADVPPSPGRRRALRRLALAASLTGVAMLGGYALAPPGLLADYRTAAGEQRAIHLADGSRVHLNTASAVSVAFTEDRRQVILYAGEAYFEVAEDSARPFIVDAGPGRIEVLGTAFSVRRSDPAVEVIVTENRVSVEASDRMSALVMAGQGVHLTGSGLGPVEPRDTATALAWRRGRLVFEETPLSAVLAELERYRNGRILVMDRAISDIPVTGTFRIERHEQALETIEHTLPVRLIRFGELMVLVFAA